MNDDDRFDARLRELLAEPGDGDGVFTRRVMATLAADQAQARQRTTILAVAAVLASLLALGFAGPSLLHPSVLAAALVLTTLCALAWLFADAPGSPRG